MRCLSMCALLLLAVSAARANWMKDVVDVNLGWIFQKYEEAPYMLVARRPGYQERTYPARKWVCSQKQSGFGSKAMEELFWTLFHYISGENLSGTKMPMTVPVTTEFTAAREANTFEMCFFIPETFQANPPTPSHPNVSISVRPEITVFTRTVGGYMRTPDDWLTEAASLINILRTNGLNVSETHMFWAGYDSPLKFLFRRNEVWFVKQ